MTKRNPVSVFFLTIITFGIYGLVWRVTTKDEMNRLGANIPTAWLIIIPFANIYWLWEYSKGVEMVTKSAVSQIVSFILLFLIPAIGDAILQDYYNKIDLQTVTVNS